ncbi:MAG TPA: hypothetical protein VNV38_11635 [Stellaceae bacterium]|jgi:hypothetical protein|nr:hypothetical protein [Stellaceae bacterium]
MYRIVRPICIALLATSWHIAEAAQLDPAQVAAAGKAADALAALGKDAYQTGKPPRQSDPKVAKLLDDVFNGTAKLNDGPDPVPLAQLEKLNDWLLAVLKAGFVYIGAGTGISDIAAIASSSDPKVDQQINANLVAFAPEMGRYYDAQLAVAHAEADTVAVELAAHPQRFVMGPAAQGLATTREGLAQTLVGVVTSFPTPGLDPAWIRDREAALMAIAPSAAKFLKDDERKQVAASALQVAGTMSDQAVKDGLTAFAKAVSP